MCSCSKTCVQRPRCLLGDVKYVGIFMINSFRNYLKSISECEATIRMSIDIIRIIPSFTGLQVQAIIREKSFFFNFAGIICVRELLMCVN